MLILLLGGRINRIALRVERDMDLGLRLGGSGIEDDYVDFLEMLEQGMEVVEMETTTCVVPALVGMCQLWVRQRGEGGGWPTISFSLSNMLRAFMKEPRSLSMEEGGIVRERPPNEPARQEMGEPRKCLA